MLAKAQAAAAQAAQQAREAAERAAKQGTEALAKAQSVDTDQLMGNAVEGLESRLSGSFAKDEVERCSEGRRLFMSFCSFANRERC